MMFNEMSHVLQAFFATLFTWGCTALGAAVVFFFGDVKKRSLNMMLGFSAGVMTAASFWSLLAPSAELAAELGMISWLTVLCGFSLGALALYIKDVFFEPEENGIGKRASMLIFSITLHNIPEGLAVGVAFGSIAYGLEGASLTAACMLALGIGIQNIPEGSAISLPLRGEGYSRGKAFFFGQLSAAVEVVAGVIGAAIAALARGAMPLMLSFAAGAMIYVVFKELIPESQSGDGDVIATLTALFGFALMTVLDIGLG